MNTVSRLMLGTAHFGLDYGLTHSNGRLSDNCAAAVFAHAATLGVDWIDTAAAYGTAECVVGEFAHSNARISTKVAGPADSNDPVGSARAQFGNSLRLLRRESTDVLLIHHLPHLLGHHGVALYDWLCEQKASGRACQIGISAYDADQIDACLERFTLDYVQLPFSLFDQRLLNSGHLAMLARYGVAVQARSLLLQGLLLANPDRLPEVFSTAAPVLRELQDVAAAVGTTPLGLALSFVAHRPELSQLVIGIDSAQQLNECIAALNTPPPNDPERFAFTGSDILDPRRWREGVRL